MTVVNKWIALAKIVNPSEVAAKCAAEGYTYYQGAIFCEIPEMGFFDPHLIYCRYGLSIPFIKIQENWKLLVEPTMDENKRWFFTGLADCVGLTPADSDQLIIQLLSQVIYASTTGQINLSSKTASEPFVCGNKLQGWAEDVDAAIAELQSWAATGLPSVPAAIGTPTGGIAPLAATKITAFVSSILSTKINGE